MNTNKPFLGVEKSLTGKKWLLKKADERIAEAISQHYDIPIIAARAMAARGVSLDFAKDFIDPKLKNIMPDPYTFKDMEKAAEIIILAIKNNKKIAIFGDYDVDGATSTALLYKFLKSINVNADIYIPDRDDGYGLNNDFIDEIKKAETNLIITVDCGISAFESIDYANSLGIEAVIIDHHEAQAKLPNAKAVVDPKRLDETDNTLTRDLAAVGVVFMLLVALNRELKEKYFYKEKNINPPDLLKFLDLVALGTVCDVVPLSGLNRAFVKQGLKIIHHRENIGIAALADAAKIEQKMSAYHLGFVLGPRINACGRLGEAALGSKILCEDDYQSAFAVAQKLCEYNDKRREIEANVLYEATIQAETLEEDLPFIFTISENWHSGVLGIVAGKLKERYQMPVFTMTIEGDIVKGSARSIPQIDIGTAVISALQAKMLITGGGHSMAAGFSLEKKNVIEFKKMLSDNIGKQLLGQKIEPVLKIDGMVDINAANFYTAETLEQLEPFGAGNEEPKIVIPDVKIINPKVFGAGHISFFLSGGIGGSIKAVAFRAVDNEIGNAILNNNNQYVNAAGVLKADRWNGRTSAQFIIEDLAFI